MTDTNDGGNGDERPTETAMRQFRALRRRTQANMLNHTKIRRRARSAGLNELADAVEEGWYYELFDRYHAENRSDETDGSRGPPQHGPSTP